MDAIGLGIAPNKEMYEAGWVFGLLPHLVAEGARLVFADIGYELMYRRETLMERFRPDFIAGELVYLTWTALDAEHKTS